MSLYKDDLLAKANEQRFAQAPMSPSHQGRARSRYCADDIECSVVLEADLITSVGWTGHACVVCRASANLICERLLGQHIATLDDIRHSLERVLNAGDGDAHWSCLSQVRNTNRRACARLPLTALDRAFSDSNEAAAPVPSRTAHTHDTHWDAIEGFRQDGFDVALATLLSVEGSSPCPIGSKLVVSSDGRFWGALSGGCVESDVVQSAVELLERDGPSVIGTYQISNSQSAEVGLPCGGRVVVHIAQAPGTEQVRSYRTAHDQIRLLDLESGACSSRIPSSLHAIAERVRVLDTPLESTLDGRAVWLGPLNQWPVLWLIGGTRVAQDIAIQARTVGFKPVIIEPRPAFSESSRFPNTEVVFERAENVLPIRADARSAVVVLTHTAELDDPALIAALQTRAFYIGALGSRKTQRGRLERLREAGVQETSLQRVHGPAGIPIDGVGPGEIALSIVAEIVATRRRSAMVSAVGAIVLAAGSSRRAGLVNKLLQPLDGKPLVWHTVRHVIEAGLPCTVVLGHEAERVREALADLPVEFVQNAQHASGMGTSIATGIGAVRGGHLSAVFVVLGDMPFVQAETLRTLARTHQPSTQHLVVIPEAGTGDQRRPGNPVLWPSRYFTQLMDLSGDAGGKAIIRDAPGAVLRIPVEDEGVLRDVDGVLAQVEPPA